MDCVSWVHFLSGSILALTLLTTSVEAQGQGIEASAQFFVMRTGASGLKYDTASYNQGGIRHLGIRLWGPEAREVLKEVRNKQEAEEVMGALVKSGYAVSSGAYLVGGQLGRPMTFSLNISGTKVALEMTVPEEPGRMEANFSIVGPQANVHAGGRQKFRMGDYYLVPHVQGNPVLKGPGGEAVDGLLAIKVSRTTN